MKNIIVIKTSRLSNIPRPFFSTPVSHPRLRGNVLPLPTVGRRFLFRFFFIVFVHERSAGYAGKGSRDCRRILQRSLVAESKRLNFPKLARPYD